MSCQFFTIYTNSSKNYLCTQGSTVLVWWRVERRVLTGRPAAHRSRCPWHMCSAGRGWRRAWRCDWESARRPRTGRSHRRGSRFLKGPGESTGLDKVSSDSSPPRSVQGKEKGCKDGLNQTMCIRPFRCFIFHSVRIYQTDQTGAGGAGVRGWREGGAGLILSPLMLTNAGADRAALSRRSHRAHAGNAWTRCTCTHHTPVLHTKTHVKPIIWYFIILVQIRMNECSGNLDSSVFIRLSVLWD